MSRRQRPRRKNHLGNYPSISVVLSITLALFVAGLAGILFSYTRELERVVQDNIRVQVYLKRDVTDSLRKVIQKTLERQEFINSSTADAVRFVSREEAARQFIRETGEDFSTFIGENPLHDSYVLAVAPAFQNSGQLKSLKTRIEKIPGVYFVDYNPNLIESVNRNRNIIAAVLAGCSIALFMVVFLLIRNTIRLALFSQRFLIRSMQLVGATRWFITRPFIWRAAGYGLLGALLAGAMLGGLLMFATGRFPELALIQNNDSLAAILGGLTGLGIFVSVFSTWGAMRMYLSLSLDELY